MNEKAVVVKSENPDILVKVGQEVVKIDPKYFRPTEVELLIGDPAKAKAKLGWVPTTTVEQLAGMATGGFREDPTAAVTATAQLARLPSP